jgi:hypothetical protein
MRWHHLLLTAAATLLPATAAAQSREDSLGIRAAAEDYLVSWYDGDAARMERAIHPELATRNTTLENGRSRLSNMGAMAMVQLTRNRAGNPQPQDKRLLEITILTIHQNIASVKVVSQDFVDLVSVAKSDGRWVIVNDLWSSRL